MDDTALCNLALGRVGLTKLIGSTSEASAEARLCDRLLTQSRDWLLRRCVWPWATTVTTLPLVEENPTDEWGYAYRYPSDCLRLLRLLGAGRVPAVAIPWKLSQDGAGRLVYCDVADAQAEYLQRVTNLAQWPDDATDALAWRLAFEIAPPLARDRGVADRCRQEAEQALRLAMASAGNERGQDAWPDPEFVRARL
jgi:hypothetical protein